MTGSGEPDDRAVPSGPTWRPAGYGDPALDGNGVRLHWVGNDIARLWIDDRNETAFIYGTVLLMIGLVVFTVRQLAIGWVTQAASAIAAVVLLAMLFLRPPWKQTLVIEIDKRRQCIRRTTGWNRRTTVSALGPFERFTVHPMPSEATICPYSLRLTCAEGARQLLVGSSEQVEDYGAKLARWLGVPLRYSPVGGNALATYEVPRATE